MKGGGVGGELQEDGGGEKFSSVRAGGAAGGVERESAVQPVGHGGQRRFVQDGLAEGAEQAGHRLDGGDAVALDVRDDGAHAVGCVPWTS